MSYLKYVLFFYFIGSYSLTTWGQGKQGLYIYGLTGYKFGSVYTTFPQDYLNSPNGYSNAYVRLGGGNNYTLAGGWMFHKNFGCELSTTYTQGISKKISDYTSSNIINSEYSKNVTSTNLHSAGSLIAQMNYKKFFFYAKAGVVIGFYNNSKIQEINTLNNIVASNTYNYNAPIMRGFNGSLGLLYPISKKISVLFEAEEVSIQGSFNKATLENSNQANLSVPNTILFKEDISGLISSSNIEYKREYPVSYSCIGVNIGLHYSF